MTSAHEYDGHTSADFPGSTRLAIKAGCACYSLLSPNSLFTVLQVGLSGAQLCLTFGFCPALLHARWDEETALSKYGPAVGLTAGTLRTVAVLIHQRFHSAVIITTDSCSDSVATGSVLLCAAAMTFQKRNLLKAELLSEQGRKSWLLTSGTLNPLGTTQTKVPVQALHAHSTGAAIYMVTKDVPKAASWYYGDASHLTVADRSNVAKEIEQISKAAAYTPPPAPKRGIKKKTKR